jgi:hypothetical protein
LTLRRDGGLHPGKISSYHVGVKLSLRQKVQICNPQVAEKKWWTNKRSATGAQSCLLSSGFIALRCRCTPDLLVGQSRSSPLLVVAP